MRAGSAAPSTASATCSASRYSDCRDRSRSWAILVTSPYCPQRTAKALAMRCGIVGMGTRSVEADRGITPTIAHVQTRIVHGLHPSNEYLHTLPTQRAMRPPHRMPDRKKVYHLAAEHLQAHLKFKDY